MVYTKQLGLYALCTDLRKSLEDLKRQSLHSLGFKCLRIKSLGEIEMEIERINSGGLGFINEYSIFIHMAYEWQPKKSQHYPSEIPFWFRVLCVPVEFKTAPMYESIGNAIGRTVAVDVEHSRVQVVVDAFKELCFETTVDFAVCVTRMRNVLYTNNSKKGAEGNRKGRGGNGGWRDGGKHDERARSYKGVIINGPVSQQNRNRESRDHHGKGKDKMFVEADSKWVKVADRGHKRNSTYRGNSRGYGEASHYRNTRREEPRHDTQEGRTRLSSDQTRVHNVQNMPREEAKECRGWI
ncbi:hypothetical protein F2Q69_00012200 [Brassica cretica]|uniref:DUF4283 domain-containing protein n=1 Tax=Brassica cretica TaxID=69181 RepID=A0A8S9QH38_BRACR|nr:hypothetical protein F2Q69_00012200 [Brassica cretica]